MKKFLLRFNKKKGKKKYKIFNISVILGKKKSRTNSIKKLGFLNINNVVKRSNFYLNIYNLDIFKNNGYWILYYKYIQYFLVNFINIYYFFFRKYNNYNYYKKLLYFFFFLKLRRYNVLDWFNCYSFFLLFNNKINNKLKIKNNLLYLLKFNFKYDFFNTKITNEFYKSNFYYFFYKKKIINLKIKKNLIDSWSLWYFYGKCSLLNLEKIFFIDINYLIFWLYKGIKIKKRVMLYLINLLYWNIFL